MKSRQAVAATLANKGLLSRKQLVLIGALLVLQALDVTTTALGLRSGLREANGFAATLMANHGEISAYVLKALATFTILAVLLLLHQRYSRLWVGVRIIAIYMFFVVGFNLVNIALA